MKSWVRPVIATARIAVENCLSGEERWLLVFGSLFDAGICRPDVAGHMWVAETSDPSAAGFTWPAEGTLGCRRDYDMYDPFESEPLANRSPLPGELLPPDCWSKELIELALKVNVPPRTLLPLDVAMSKGKPEIIRRAFQLVDEQIRPVKLQGQRPVDSASKAHS